MNEIRKNTEEEKLLLKAVFKMPKMLIAIYVAIIIFSAFFFASGIAVEALGYDGVIFISMGLAALLVISITFILHAVGIKKSSCCITNKRIYGTYSMVYFKKSYSYRLDEIDNVELVSFLGMNAIMLDFSQGKQTTKTQNNIFNNNSTNTAFRIAYVANSKQVYTKISGLIGERKNEKDLMVDIEMSKIQAETKKAEAFEKIAANMGGANQQQTAKSDYLEELKELNELRNAGIISESEFEAKKKQLLGLK